MCEKDCGLVAQGVCVCVCVCVGFGDGWPKTVYYYCCCCYYYYFIFYVLHYVQVAIWRQLAENGAYTRHPSRSGPA